MLSLSGVYAQLMTKSALRVLEKHGIALEYQTLTPHLLNEDKTGLVPTEHAVRDIDDPQEALTYISLCHKCMKNDCKSGKNMI